MSMDNVYPIVEAGKLELKPGFKELTAYLDEQNIPYVIASSNFKKISNTIWKRLIFQGALLISFRLTM